MEQPTRLGEILLKAGVISEIDLARAIRQQQSTDRRLGEILCSLGCLTEGALVRALAEQLGLKVVPQSRLKPDPDLIPLFPAALLSEYSFLPIRLQGDGVEAVVFDPLDETPMQCLRFFTGREPRVMVAGKSLIDKAIEPYLKDSMPIHEGAVKDLLSWMNGLETGFLEQVRELCLNGLSRRASSLHALEEQGRLSISFKINGVLEEAASWPGLLIRPLAHALSTSTAFKVRLSVIATANGIMMTARFLRHQIATESLSEMPLNEDTRRAYEGLLADREGLVVIVGPPGFGKSRVLSASAAHLAGLGRQVIMLSADMDEAMPGSLGGIIHIRSAPSAGLISDLEFHDPDAVLVDDAVEPAALEAAARLALSGRLVIMAVPARDAVSLWKRIGGLQDGGRTVLTALRGILHPASEQGGQVFALLPL